MSILLILWLVIAVIAVTVYLVLNAKSEPESEDTGKGEYSSVTIDFGKSDACPAVMKIFGLRFLCKDAPTLPLVGCTGKVCSCIFRHYDDRRAGLRRAEEEGIIQRRYEGVEKRVEQRARRAEETFSETVEQEKKQISDTQEDTYYDFIEKTGSWPAPKEK
jgi:hypothetical protein